MNNKKKPNQDAGAKALAKRLCGTCYHWERHPDRMQAAGEDVSGECTLHPPKVLGLDEEGTVTQARPVMTYHERCGQHFPKVN